VSLPSPPPGVRSADNHIGLDDFYAVPESHQFIYMPTRGHWPKESVDTILPPIQMPYKRNGKFVKLKPSAWLKQYRRVEQITWAPGLPEIIEDKLISDGGWKDRPGAHGLNLYQPPTIIRGDAAKATPWTEHLQTLYPEDAEDITNWCAHRVQYPGVKINHALVMGGGQGIGKDWLLQALKLTIGAWNFQEISPTDLLTPYNPFVRAVVLRMNEAHDLGESGRADRYGLYERVKIYAAAPPDVLACVDKYIRRHYVPNVLGLIITTNHKTDGVYLPSDDRRHLVAWSARTKEEFPKEFWNERWRWLLQEGGDQPCRCIPGTARSLGVRSLRRAAPIDRLLRDCHRQPRAGGFRSGRRARRARAAADLLIAIGADITARRGTGMAARPPAPALAPAPDGTLRLHRLPQSIRRRWLVEDQRSPADLVREGQFGAATALAGRARLRVAHGAGVWQRLISPGRPLPEESASNTVTRRTAGMHESRAGAQTSQRFAVDDALRGKQRQIGPHWLMDIGIFALEVDRAVKSGQ
jgi:hypothetical protein